MGTVGGLISTNGGEAADQRLNEALGLPPHVRHVEVLHRGQSAIGVSASTPPAGLLAAGKQWSVALSGVVDTIGETAKPSEPALLLAQRLDAMGPAACDDVTGEFACVATDGQRIIAFRDHLGSNPLFVGTNGPTASVMTEPKQVVHALGRSRRPDLEALVSVFFSQWEAEDDVPCAVEGVDRVPRGFLIEADFGGWRRHHRTWDPKEVVEASRLSVSDAVDQAWDRVSDAVEVAIRGKTAISLSGGIDSTLIAAAMAGVAGQDVGAVSAVYPDAPSVDESAYIEETLAFLGMRGSTYRPDRGRLDDLDLWVDRLDGPTHGLALGDLSQMNDVAAGHGYQTLLSGEMAEIVFDLREHALGRIIQRGRFMTAKRHVSQLRSRGMPWGSLVRLVGASMLPTGPALAYTRRREAHPPAPWLDATAMPGLGRRWDLERPPTRRWADIQLFFATGPSILGLEATTVMGDYAGVALRRPLAERRLWEFFLSLPPEIKFPDSWTKSLLRRALDGRAPNSVIWRTDKTVFDEDSKQRADYQTLSKRISDGFRLPGVRYEILRQRLESETMSSLEISLARALASIHAFVKVAS